MPGDRNCRREVVVWNAVFTAVMIAVFMLTGASAPNTQSVLTYYPPYLPTAFEMVAFDIAFLAMAIGVYAYSLWKSWPILRGGVAEARIADALAPLGIAGTAGILLVVLGSMYLTKPILIAGPNTTMAFNNSAFGLVFAVLGAGLIALDMALVTIHELHAVCEG